MIARKADNRRSPSGGRRNNPRNRGAFDASLEASRPEREAREAFADRARRLALNPYNFGGIEGAPRMCNFDYWAARFEAEGRDAPQGWPNPYSPGTMAANRWQAGQLDCPSMT